MKNGIAKGITAILIAGVLAAGVCCTGFASRGDDGKWFGNSDIKTWHWTDKTGDNAPDNSDGNHDNDPDNSDDNENMAGAVLNEFANEGISLFGAVLPVAAYAANDISPYAEKAFLLTAEIIPDDAANKAVEWSVSWKNNSSAWANGKNVTDYVTATPVSDGSLNANVECRQAFGEKVLVTVKSCDNSSATASCTVDYVAKATGVSLKFGNFPINVGGTTEFKYELGVGVAGCGGATNLTVNTNSVYTVTDNFNYTVSLGLLDDSHVPVNISGSVSTLFSLKGLGFGGLVSDEDLTISGYDFDRDNVNSFNHQERVSSKSIYFNKLSTAEIADYFSDITNPYAFAVEVTVNGAYSNWSGYSVMKCVGYTNNTPVSGVSVGDTNLIF